MNVVFMPCVLVAALILIILAAIGTLGPSKHHRKIDILDLILDNSTTVAILDDNFVCATIDWWPREKCNYGSCSWNNSSALNLNLTSPLLENAVKALSPLLIRVGGSLEDQVVYDLGSPATPCVPFTEDNSARFHFSGGCFSMSRWQELNDFFQKTGSAVAFGLNSLYGRKLVNGHYSGPWESSNARDFINYTVSQGYNVKAWELGNEISGDAGVTLDPKVYASDASELRRVMEQVYEGKTMPTLVAPDGFFNYSWYREFLRHTNAADAISIHVYNLGPANGVDIASKILKGSYNTQYQTLKRLINNVESANKSRMIRAWVGESGGAYNGGQHMTDDAFVSSFWYLDQLGMAALQNIAVFCRQTLVGGNYGLLDANFHPNPDFYAALLWKKFMGKTVLNATSQSPDLHTYAHCLQGSKSGGLTVLLINFGETPFAVKFNEHLERQEYHLSALNGDLRSPRVLINGHKPTKSITNLVPMTVRGFNPSLVAPHSIAFVTIPDALIPACLL